MRGRDEGLGLAGPRGARISVSFDTGEWWDRCPEQMVVWTETVPGAATTVLGIAKMNREPVGKTGSTRRWRPHRYLQSVRALYWDLNDPTHVRALMRSLRHVGAMAAGVREGLPGHGIRPEDRNPLGARRRLCRSRVDGLSDRAGDPVTGSEVVDLEEDSSRRARHGAGFRIHRRVRRDGLTDVGITDFNGGSELWVPMGAAERLVKAVADVLMMLATRVAARPHEASGSLQRHYLPSRRRLWTADPNELPYCVERLEWLELRPEPALFDDPGILKGRGGRLAPGAKTSLVTIDPDWGPGRHPRSIAGYDRLHLRRADALMRGRLRWDPRWGDEDEAVDDARHATGLLVGAWTALVFLSMMLATSRVRDTTSRIRSPGRSAAEVPGALPCPPPPTIVAQPTARGPPVLPTS